MLPPYLLRSQGDNLTFLLFAIKAAQDHLFSEIVEVPVLSLVIIGMYQGIEIDHPIYALIFCDLIVCFIFTGKLIIFLD